MTATMLTSAGIKGTLTGSAVTPSFNCSGCYFSVVLTFDATAQGFVRLTRSTDDTNFIPFTNVQDGTPLCQLTASGSLQSFSYAELASWRLEASLTGGSVSYALSLGSNGTDLTNGSCDVRTRYTTAQLQQFDTLRSTQITNAGIAGDLTLYKRCRSGRFAKLLVPAAVPRFVGRYFVPKYRWVRAQSANVVSVFDRNGNTVPSAQSYLVPPGQQYTAGTTVASRALPDCYDGQLAFSDPGSDWGISGYLTLFEAVADMGLDMVEAPANLAALGLA